MSSSHCGCALRCVALALLVAAGCGVEAEPPSDAGGGEAGAGADSQCPIDFIEADRTPCTIEGQFCSDGPAGPCDFGNSMLCRHGLWAWSEAFPEPCGGSGNY